MHAFIGLGSNLGDREAQIRAAAARLGALPGVAAVCLSAFFETSPVGGPPQGWYLNAVARLDTGLSPRELLEACLEIERSVGRERSVPDAPRVLDLDVLLVGDRVLDEAGLVVPHPRLHRRRFVLAPLAELAPGQRHPVLGRTALDLLADLDLESGSEVVRPYPS